MSHEKKVQILLSTYNGERYLQEQLDSIIKQSYADWVLTIRDDGSTDGTLKIVEKYVQKYPDKINYFSDANIGACQSFLALADQADKSCVYYAFCDQDDVWKEDKLERAVQQMVKSEEQQGNDKPVLYCSALDIVDENRRFIQKKDMSIFSSRMRFGNALVENVCTGCTMVVNKLLLESVQNLSKEFMDKILMHDWWMYLYASCFGVVIYDSYSGIQYRQHQNNVVGEKVGFFSRLWSKLSVFFRNRGKLMGQIEVFYKAYGEQMPVQDASLVQDCLTMKGHFRKRIYMAVKGTVYRLSRQNNLICKLLILADLL